VTDRIVKEFQASALARDADVLDMSAVRRGEIERFTKIVERHQRSLFRYAYSRLGCRFLAEDAVQQSFLAVFESRAAFDPARGFRGWLWTIHVNECSRTARMRIRLRRDESGRRAIPARGEGPDSPLERREDQEQILEALNALPEEQADAVRLRYFGELSFEEIGATTGAPAATAKSRVRYGLAKLARRLRRREEMIA
jgi:RNA polymerase sigma-70 factor (ECF subfamily)